MTDKLSIFKIADDSFQVEYENPSEIIEIISRYSDRKVEVIPNQNLVKISGAPKKSGAPNMVYGLIEIKAPEKDAVASGVRRPARFNVSLSQRKE